VREFWLPWFRMGKLVNSEAPPPSGTRWHLLTIIQIKWVVILLCSVCVFWFVIRHLPGQDYRPPAFPEEIGQPKALRDSQGKPELFLDYSIAPGPEATN
jgi:hypothetical protein